MSYQKLALLALLLAMPGSISAQDTLENRIKATYIDKFSLYVQWPSEAAEFPGGNLAICVVGDDPVGALLNEVNGQQFDEHPILVHNVDQYRADEQCSVLYLTGPDNVVTASLSAVIGRPVLTITNEATTMATTGIINLVLADNHVRFAVDTEKARQNNLRISSKLLGVAQKYR